jgi:uncharacterized protein
MKITKLYLILFLVLAFISKIVSAGEEVQLKVNAGELYGTLELTNSPDKCPVILIIAGSGPTDRDGNNSLAGVNNSLKYLAEELSDKGIASLRYDKRGTGKSIYMGLNEKDLRFEDYINDALLWCNKLRGDDRFSKLVIVGHSEGSLIGMVAARKAGVDAFVSIAGAGHTASNIILTQLKGKVSEDTFRECETIIIKLNEGKITDNITSAPFSLFRPSVQPYMISWFKYDPAKELSSLNIPILITQGTTDIQVSVDDAKILSASNKKTELLIIEGMNHILKEVPDNMQEQSSSYSNPDLPVMPELVTHIAQFIKALDNI